MKKALALAALALLLVPDARAFNPVSGASATAVPTHALQSWSKPYERRINVIIDSRDDALNQTNVKAEKAAWAKWLGSTFDAWKQQGAEVHFYRSDWFEQTNGNGGSQRTLALYQTLGSDAPVAVMLGFNTDGATSRRKYFSADSTTTKLIHIGGWNGAQGQTDSTYGVVDMAGSGATSAAGRYFDSRNGSGVRAYGSANTDTLWFGLAGYGRRSGTLPSGVAQVVRLFEPVTSGHTYFGWGGDSINQVMPALGDTVAKAGEVMPVAWRVYWTTSGRSVDYVKLAGTPIFDTGNMGHVLTTIVSRYVKLDPFLAAMEWDDVFDVNPTTGTRITNAAMDSLVSEFRHTWGIPVAMSTNPRHAAEYYAGSDPTREAAWSGEAWTWQRRHRIPWVHHAHDSTSSDISSGLVGGFGGYSTHNGSTDANWTTDSLTTFGVNRYRRSPRYATAAVNGDAYTIKYRLQWADSLRRATCPECFTPPYLSFPNNEMLPPNWRLRTGQSVASAVRSGFVSRWATTMGDGLCGIDSVFVGIHEGLGMPSGAELFLRGTIANNGLGATANFAKHGNMPSWMTTGPPGDDHPRNWFVHGDNDSVVAKSPFMYPGERVSFRLDGKLYRIRNVGTTPYDGVAALNYKTNVSRVLPALMGSRTGNLTAAGFSSFDEAWENDPGGMTKGGSGANPQKNSGVERTRMVYMHPATGSTPNAVGPNASYPVQANRLGLLGGLRVLEAVAGHRLIQWVYPWEVYANR